MSVIGDGWHGNIGCSCWCAEWDAWYSKVAVFSLDHGRGEHCIYLQRWLVADPSFSTTYVVPGIPSVLFLYLSASFSLLCLLSVRLDSVDWHILLIVAVLSCEFSFHSCNRGPVSWLAVTRWSRENGRNCWYVGATQPIGIFLPPLFGKPTQLCRFALFPTLFVMVHAIDLLPSPWHSPFLVPPCVFPIIVWMGRLPELDVRCSTHPQVPYSPLYPPAIPTIISPSLSTLLNTSIVLLYISCLLLPPIQMIQISRMSPFVWC